MLRFSILSMSALFLGGTLLGQQELTPTRIVSPVKSAGTYHVASGTWTRAGNASANLGPDVIYSATSDPSYFSPIPGRVTDEGILPGTGHPEGGSQDSYKIDGFTIGYCSFGYASTDLELDFYDSYVSCDLPSEPINCIQLAHQFALNGLPNNGCWFVTIDLAGGEEFCMRADGGLCAPGYQGGDLDSFGWTHNWIGNNGTSSATIGHLIAGYDPGWAPGGEGTCYNPAVSCGPGNTGLGGDDRMAIEWHSNTLPPGCFWFGGYVNSNGCAGAPNNPGAQFYLELFTDCSVACSTDCTPVNYCDTHPDQNGTLSISTCSVSAGSVVLTTSGCSPSTVFAYYNVSASNGVVTSPAGSIGDLCLTGSPIGRYNKDIQPVVGGSYATDLWNTITTGSGGTLPGTLGGHIFACDTWHFQGWHRMSGPPTTWSDALEVLFTP